MIIECCIPNALKYYKGSEIAQLSTSRTSMSRYFDLSMKVYTTKINYRLCRRKVRNIFPLKKHLQHGGNEKYLYRNRYPKLNNNTLQGFFLQNRHFFRRLRYFPVFQKNHSSDRFWCHQNPVQSIKSHGFKVNFSIVRSNSIMKIG